MLEFYPLGIPDSIFSFLKSQNLAKTTWVVSDLKSKNEIQKLLIDKQGYFLESSILRASDFWKIALRRLAPQIQVVSGDFMQIVVDSFVQKFGEQLDIKELESSTLHAFVQELAPILLQPQSNILLDEWFLSKHEEKKWKRWYLLARGCINFIIYENQMIDSRWIAAYLQTLDISVFHWPNDLIIDLGTEMSSVEMGLFKVLSNKSKVQIIWPQPKWQIDFPLLLKTYSDSSGYGNIAKVEKAAIQSGGSAARFIRVSTQLAEVKFAIAQIRKWHDQGASLNDIAIVSPQIENYWPVLKFFLDEEGVNFQKDHVIKINSIGLVQNFLAYCNNLQHDVSWESLETSLYSRTQSSDRQYESFKSLFYQLYDDSDLMRDNEIKKLFYQKIDYTKPLGRSDFLIVIVKIWQESIQFHGLPTTEQNSLLFELIFKDFLARSADIKSDFKKWMLFLQSCINSKEIKTELSQELGIQVLPLMSSHLSSAKFQLWLGMDEKSLASRKKHLIPVSDIFELKSNFDFSIEYPEESFYDFNVRWLFEKIATEKIYICANSSFESEPLTPSLFFLEHNRANDVVIPAETRHDEVQNYLKDSNAMKILESFKISNYDLPRVGFESLYRDLNNTPNIVPNQNASSLSPSDLEEYWKCGFKLLAQKFFLLRDLPQVAVDLDPRQKGSLLHQLFEFLTSEKNNLDSTGSAKTKIINFLDLKRGELHIYPQDDLLWTVQKTKMLQVGTAFFEFEKNRRQASHEASEKSFEIYFDLEKKDFVIIPSNKSIKIKGRIDRVDKASNGIIIFDYKASTNDLKYHGDWLKNGEFQLLLYLLACEKILYPGQDVIASIYYDYKKFEFSKGYMDENFHAQFIENNRKKKSVASLDSKRLLLIEFNELLAALFLKLQMYDFTALPVDVEICTRCNWSKLCRARHLM